jgi:type I restriction enzyme S subunit
MEVKQGFKQTEVGIVPEDWGLIKLENNITLKARIGWQGLTTKEYLSSGNYTLVTGTDFQDGYINWNSCVFVERIRFEQDKNIQLKVGDVLVTKDGTIGKVAFVDRLPNPTTLNSGVFVLRPKNKDINNRFFYTILMSFYFDEFLNKITAGSTITHLYQKDFVHFNFVLPSIKEQTAIANALSEMDALISQTEKLIEKKKAIKQGAMQELLKPKEGWVTKKLGEVCDIYQPQTISAVKFTNDGYLVFGANGVVGYYNQYNHKEWQVMITCRGSTCGTVNKSVNFSWITGNAMVMNVDNNKKIDKVFFYYLLLKQDYSQTITGSGQPQIVRAPLANFWIKLPKDIEQQKMIGETLKDIDASIEKSETKLQKLKQQKQGMMQALLTGKIRLI